MGGNGPGGDIFEFGKLRDKSLAQLDPAPSRLLEESRVGVVPAQHPTGRGFLGCLGVEMPVEGLGKRDSAGMPSGVHEKTQQGFRVHVVKSPAGIEQVSL